MLYRAQDHKGTSSLGFATSHDGIHFERRSEPVMASEAPYEKGGGVEDPRLVKFGRTFYLTYTGYNNVDGVGADKKDAQLCLATSTDLIHWQRRGIIFPAYKGKWNVKWTKSGAIVPKKINGKYSGPPPIVTREGILLIYNGADDNDLYSTGWVLFDKHDPTKVLARANEPIFSPQLDWEKVGQVPNVVFVEGMARDGKRWLFYYGGADKHVGVATAPVR